MKITAEIIYNIIVEDVALNQYEDDLYHSIPWSEFKIMFPNHPLDGVSMINYHPDDNIYHVAFRSGDVIAESDPQNNSILKWCEDNKNVIRQAFVDDLISKDPSRVDFYNIDPLNLV